MTEFLYLTDNESGSEEEDENPADISSIAPGRNLWTGKMKLSGAHIHPQK